LKNFFFFFNKNKSNFTRRLFRVVAFNFKDSLEELNLKKCGLSTDTLEFISFGIYSGLKIESEKIQDYKNIKINEILEWNDPLNLKNKLILKKVNLSYNKWGNSVSWRIFIRNMVIFARDTLEELDISNCDLTNSQAIGVVDGFKDAI
jgi:hypothetical protein